MGTIALLKYLLLKMNYWPLILLFQQTKNGVHQKMPYSFEQGISTGWVENREYLFHPCVLKPLRLTLILLLYSFSCGNKSII